MSTPRIKRTRTKTKAEIAKAQRQMDRTAGQIDAGETKSYKTSTYRLRNTPVKGWPQ